MELIRKKEYAWLALAAFVLALTGIAWPSGAQAGDARAASPRKAVPLMVDVGAKKCIPCKMMAPILEELKKEYEGVFAVEFVDIRENPGEAEKYRIRAIPTQIFYDASGREFYRHMGYFSKEQILDTFKKNGIDIRKPAK